MIIRNIYNIKINKIKLMNYEGYGRIRVKDSKEHVQGSEFMTKRWPYRYHYEDWTGEEVYHLSYPNKKFITSLFITSIVLIAMRVLMEFI